ncbi:amidophosphoribosyltransferase [Hathewaya histolytica]|uniref:Amidophosphoribosyltransferase n=1 Tax=Hathewaya histolytica TaxID=1498 RepID=A0A4U9RSU6_HATHI|nr:amidophosphoribosyltransferase [Hathewaya histolytica]VTQ92090.1 amidophosphoribosyltransferase [Hathewaya histolytica]
MLRDIKDSCSVYKDEFDDKFHDECGVYGVFSKEGKLDVARITYYGLYALQHRGQESAGIVTSNGEVEMKCHKGMGLVSEVFNENILNNMVGNSAIGHVRYSTAGESSIKNAQPILGSFKLGDIAIAHNGNLVNAEVIRGLLEDGGCVFQTSIDSEVILNLISRGAKNGIENAVVDTVQAIKGSYGIVILTKDELIGVRDPQGIRPLCIGKIGESYVIASESCALDTTGAEFVRDVEPGEIVIVNEKGIRSINFAEKSKRATCSFEYIYFARPDSVIDGISVNHARVETGKKLFEEAPVEADVVIGVPDSGVPAAIGYSRASGIPFDMALIKNRYVGRTFIKPTQELRERSVTVKLNALKEVVKGKRVILIDDSIVRGTTSKILIQIIRNAGAKEVHFRVSSPVVNSSCYFGIDTPYRKDLIGANNDLEAIREEIGADTLAYLSIEGLLHCLGNAENSGFCLGCFNGIYPIAAPIK